MSFKRALFLPLISYADSESIERAPLGWRQWLLGIKREEGHADLDVHHPLLAFLKVLQGGVLADGRKINFRSKSSDKRATVEIQSPSGKSLIKIRYN